MTSLSVRNLRPRTARKNPGILTPVPASWLVIRDKEELRHILSVFPEGLLSDVMCDLIACPAVRELTIRYSDSVAACQLVDAEHLRRYASPYVAEAGSDGLFIRFFLPEGDRLEYIGCNYCSRSSDGMIRRCTGIPDGSPLSDDVLESLRDSGDLWSQVFFAVNALLLRGGITPVRYKRRGRVGAIRCGKEMTKLPGRVEIIQLPPEKLGPAAVTARKSLEKLIRERRCPVWPVRGHWRHYRSGKTVYIAPYTKGPERDTRECPGREYITGGKHDDKK